MLAIRTADAGLDGALAEIDVLTWHGAVSPAPAPQPGESFFGVRVVPADVLVAEDGGRVLGYVQFGPGFGVPAHEHVLELNGLAVHPHRQGGGVGEALVRAALSEARRRGKRKVTLRVLGTNAVAQRLYRRCGFELEGTLRGEFLLDGEHVDDLLMARYLH